MSKKQSVLEKINNPYYFLTASLAIIVLTFAFFTPKVSSSLFPFKRDMVFNNFLNSTKNENTIDPQKFWEFREFYSPGYFYFNDQGINNSLIADSKSQLGINPSEISLYFSRFSSNHSLSLDGLTSAKSLNQVFDISQADMKKLLFQNSNSLIFKDSNNQTYVVFILPESEMQKANGFFDYQGKDKNLLKNKNWFSITKLDR